MKILKGLAIFSFFSLLLGSCFDPPEFPNEPQIVFDKLVFIETPDQPGSPVVDSLILYINFKDGDGDLGLPSNGENISDPFHPLNYYMGTSFDSKDTVSIPTTISPNPLLRFPLLNVSAVNGKLITFDKRGKEGFTLLPPYESPFNCTRYDIDTLIVEQADKDILDDSYNVYDTVRIKNDQNEIYEYYFVADTFYVQPNPNYSNIEIDFLVRNPDNPDEYIEFDWRTYTPFPNVCGQTFDQRFPVLSEGSAPLDGTLTYSMESRGFRKIFGANVLRLRVQIKDRALHLSNSILTPPFTLDEIKR
jgi:hypothetical protein